ncbi:MAG: RraA family protein [Dehalococcoidia bacterium]|nr:RraA family protein [Dehalococcoidia bacterium]
MAESTAPLTEAELDAIRQLDTPTISNALELIDGLRPWTDGFTRPDIVCRFPEFKTVVGYAVTVEIASAVPGRKSVPRDQYWDSIVAQPSPRMIVIHDRDYPNPLGSFWGEVNGSIAKGLGAVGVVTDGTVRDLDEVREMGFQFLSKDVCVSHAYVHAEALGTTIEISGMKVSPGDLIAADKHGAIQIPLEVARDVPRLAELMGVYEAPMIKAAQAPGATPDKLRAAAAEQATVRENNAAY